MTARPKKILIFDSGLGGISILQAIWKQYPFCQLLYCTDNEAFPYGTKPEAELIERVSKVLIQLEKNYNPDIFVIACNTASTVALPKVRSLIKAPVVGVVPAIKPAVALAKTPCIGLLATPGTIHRAYTQSLIDQFGGSLQWIRIGSSELVQLAESKMYGRDISAASLQEIVAPFSQCPPTELDTVVLACTHFPLIKPELQQALPNILNWIDSSEAIANRVGFWLHTLGLRIKGNPPPSENNEIIFTKALPDTSGITPLLQKLSITKINTLSI